MNGITVEGDDRPVTTRGCCSYSPWEAEHINPAKLERETATEKELLLIIFWS